ncbi:hypothetical protein [Rheinheimera sp. NSM]|uniref:hypothetical protein n=1 Tax=Rheinheimera sp. NSM TaxID=3457884 RepID=UPI004034FEA0
MLNKLLSPAALLLGLAALVNGSFMTIAPETWYWLVPGVPDRGPFNQHFLRDIGMNYLLLGAAFVYGALYRKQRLILWSVPTAWLVSHAVFHVWEVLVGICGPQSLIDDFAGVTLPALVALSLLYAGAKEQPDA